MKITIIKALALMTCLSLIFSIQTYAQKGVKEHFELVKEASEIHWENDAGVSLSLKNTVGNSDVQIIQDEKPTLLFSRQGVYFNNANTTPVITMTAQAAKGKENVVRAFYETELPLKPLIQLEIGYDVLAKSDETYPDAILQVVIEEAGKNGDWENKNVFGPEILQVQGKGAIRASFKENNVTYKHHVFIKEITEYAGKHVRIFF